MPGQSSVSTGMGLGHRDLIDLRRVHVTNPMMWAIEAGTDFWILGAANTLETAGNHLLTDGGWTVTATTTADGSGADFMSKADPGTPGTFVMNAAADLIQSPSIFGNYVHAHQASAIVGAKAMPKYLVCDMYASFTTASSDELTSNLGFVEDGGSIVTSADIMAAFYSNSVNWAVQSNAVEDVSAIAVDNAYHWFRILMDLGQSKSFGYVDGTLVSTSGIAITADEFPVAFGVGVGTNNDIQLAQGHVFYAWSFPNDPSDF